MPFIKKSEKTHGTLSGFPWLSVKDLAIITIANYGLIIIILLTLDILNDNGLLQNPRKFKFYSMWCTCKLTRHS